MSIPGADRTASCAYSAMRRQSLRWFDRVMGALEQCAVTVTFCFTPEHLGVKPHHTSPPRDVRAFAEFCAATIRRYA